MLIPNPKFYRFKEKKISINPPSKTLHLSNIAREMYTEKEIAQVFGECCGRQAHQVRPGLTKAPEQEER